MVLHRPVELAGVIGMYGPPQRCKRKTNDGSWSAPMYSALSGVTDSGPRWISARPRPYNVDGLVKTFSDIRFRERGRDPLPSLFSASRPGGNSFPLNRDFMQTQQERECDSVGSYLRPPKPCEPACWPKPR